MTPEQKGEELINKFYFSIVGVESEKNIENAKRCAIICVEEIVDDREDALDVMQDSVDLNLVNVSMQYWQSVLTILKNKAQ